MAIQGERIGEWQCIESGPVENNPMLAGCTQEAWIDDGEEFIFGIIQHGTAGTYTLHVTTVGQGKLDQKLVRGARTRDEAWRKGLRAVELLRELEAL